MDDVITVDDKSFCPNTRERIWTEEEAEEMEPDELKFAQRERIKLVRHARPAIWKVVLTK